ncbi:hypothetical protein [Leuconostoc carnosum]|uniref:hypothetical protein n=1 Tax=Leuconostoc carnosum TaxID=1252 RepID=UPI00345DD3E3
MLKEKKSFSKFYFLMVIVLNTILFGVNMLSDTMTWKQDVWFHISRIHEINMALNNGQIPTLVSFNSFSSVGQAVNGMYPQLTLIVLTWMTHWLPPIAQYFAIFTIPIVFGSCVIFLIAKKLNVSSFNALVFTMMISSLMRPQFNNIQTSLSMVILTYATIVCFYSLKVISEKNDFNAVLLLAVAVALVANTHILSTILLVIYLLFLTAYFFYYSKYKFKMIRGITMAVGVAVSLSFFTIYSIVKLLINHLTSPTNFLLVNSTLDLDKLLANSVNWKITTSLSVFAFIAFIMIIKNWEKLSSLEKYLFGLAMGLILVMTPFIPWASFQDTPISIIQFPTRLLIFTNLTLILLMMFLLRRITKKTIGIILILLSVMIIVGNIANNWQYRKNVLTIQKPGENKNLTTSINNNSIQEPDFFDIRYYPEYLPKKSLKNNANIRLHQPDKQQFRIFNHQALSHGTKITGEKKSTTYNSVTYDFANVKQGKFLIPFFVYDNLNYKVLLNGKSVHFDKNSQGSITVNIPHSGHQTIKMELITPKFYNIIWKFNIIMLGLVITWIIYKFKYLPKVEV